MLRPNFNTPLQNLNKCLITSMHPDSLKTCPVAVFNQSLHVFTNEFKLLQVLIFDRLVYILTSLFAHWATRYVYLYIFNIIFFP